MNCRFRGTTLPHEELLIALENVIIDKVTRHSVSKVKKTDTSAPMDIGMAAGTDGEEAFEEGCGKHLILQCKQCTREQEPKVDGVEERGPSCVLGVCWRRARTTSGKKSPARNLN